MKTKEILIVGAGIAGCAAALALAKRDIAVSILTSSFDQRVYHSPFIQHDYLEEKVLELQQTKVDDLSCSRAYDQLALLAPQSVNELLESHYLVDRNGNIDIHRCLKEQLEQFEQVEWMSPYSLIDLLTLERHSIKRGDQYKKPACFGVTVYNHETHQVENILAKEVILATGGAPSLFPYSTHPSSACGQGIAIANRAGARLLNMDQVQFHPLGLFEKERPCFPLPLQLLAEGGILHAEKGAPLEVSLSPHELVYQLHDQLLKTRSTHLWLDLSSLDPAALKDRFPTMDAYCLIHGFNIAKDALPVVPAAFYTSGGLAIDRVGQTSLQRLRAIGEVSCTGLFCAVKDESVSVLESLTWATALAEDIAKQIKKLVYYFPAMRDETRTINPSWDIVEEDWKLLKEIMWAYAGIKRDRARLERGCALVEELRRLNGQGSSGACSIEQIQLSDAIETALIIIRAALANLPMGYRSSLAGKVGIDLSDLKSRIESKI